LPDRLEFGFSPPLLSFEVADRSLGGNEIGGSCRYSCGECLDLRMLRQRLSPMLKLGKR